MKKIYTILFFFCVHIAPLPAIEGLKFESITNKDGVSHNTVRHIMQDSRGFMWISTINGLNRYDGHRFVFMQPEFGVASLSENNIRRTIEDNNGHIWIHTTSRFVNCYDTHTESFIDYTGKNEARIYKQIEVMPDGDVWLWGTDDGACHVQHADDNMITTLYDKNNIGTNHIAFVLESEPNEPWIGTDKGLLQVINGIPKYCNTGNVSYNYHSAVELKERIYFFTHNDKIIVFDKVHRVFLPSIDLSYWKGLGITHTTALDEHYILITGKQATLVLHTDTEKVADAAFLFNGERLTHTHIFTDNHNNCWVYNKSGNVWLYQKEWHRFKRYAVIPPHILSVIDSERYDIHCDSRGFLWITTFGNGLFVIEDSGKVNHFTTANSGLKTNYLLSVSEDRLGDIWIGTEYTGVVKISLTKYNNNVFFPNPEKTDDLDKAVRTIYENQSNGDVWIGTKGGDVYLFDKDLKAKSVLQLKKGLPYCITADLDGNTWIGTKGSGVIVIPQGETTIRSAHTHLLREDNDLGANNIYAILCDHKGRMWVGSFGSGIFLCEQKDRHIRTTSFSDISNKQKQVRCMIVDNSGMIWVGGENGIVVFNPDSLIENNSSFVWFNFDRNNPQSLNNNIVKSLYQDSWGQVWAGTSGGGLNLAIKGSSIEDIRFKHYTSEEGLINNVVQAILEDNRHHLWISTENGISKFDPTNVIFENYNFPDTWESDLFCESSFLKRKNEELLFGSYNGMYIFDPSSFENQVSELPVIITGLSINGIPVTPYSSDTPLSESITHTQCITLKDNQRSFSIEFSSFNYQSAHSNRYTYILENYDREWNPVTQYNIATYKNIPAGKYTFKVKNQNHPNAQAHTETRLEIIVVPPVWKSTEALIIYFVLFVAIIYFSLRLVIKMNRLHNEVEVEKQLTEFRLRFFTNISHEFRTPLTIIRGSIENMSELPSLPATVKKYVRTLDKSSSRLMRLIDQLLEFRKVQHDKVDLRLEKTEVVGYIKGIYDVFAETAEKKDIHFTFCANKEARMILLDRGKIEKVVFNLLSNAFKHTPAYGNIAIDIAFDDAEGRFTVRVADSGIGIPAEKHEWLFVRFKQINYSDSGIGIGLNLTSELVTAHKGQITYSDSQWGGACFTVTIPTHHDAYAPESIIKEDTPSIDIAKEHPDTEVPPAIATNIYKILLIEDDEEIRSFLKEQLEESFTIITAPNGLVGWEAAIHEQPNLIVCDVMMPEMDGFEVTRKIKADFETCHIPIILLTAHSSIEHQLEGINAGADSYITKPFSPKYLTSRIVKLIEQREKLQRKFAHEPGMVEPTICTTDKDKAFIEKMHRIIEENIDEPDFSIDDFAQAAHMGRTLFYKKIKGITNFSPNEYLRIIRLKKAAELLKGTDLTVSEVAYNVGFNDPDYFSKCFKEQFGMRPTQFRAGENKK